MCFALFGQMVQSQLASSPDAGAFLGDEALDGSGSGDGYWNPRANDDDEDGDNDDDDDDDSEGSGSGMRPTTTGTSHSHPRCAHPHWFASIFLAGVLPAGFHCRASSVSLPENARISIRRENIHDGKLRRIAKIGERRSSWRLATKSRRRTKSQSKAKGSRGNLFDFDPFLFRFYVAVFLFSRQFFIHPSLLMNFSADLSIILGSLSSKLRYLPRIPQTGFTRMFICVW